LALLQDGDFVLHFVAWTKNKELILGQGATKEWLDRIPILMDEGKKSSTANQQASTIDSIRHNSLVSVLRDTSIESLGPSVYVVWPKSSAPDTLGTKQELVSFAIDSVWGTKERFAGNFYVARMTRSANPAWPMRLPQFLKNVRRAFLHFSTRGAYSAGELA
jgi:hypothetical protein